MVAKIHKYRIKFLHKKYIKLLTKFYTKLTLLKKWYVLKQTIPTQAYFHRLTIHIKPNNIFCTLTNIYKKKVILHYNSGMFLLKTTKKRLKHNVLKMLFFFFKKIYKRLKNTLIINIIGPKTLKKKILKQLSHTFLKRQHHILINIDNKKCFNGCRPMKKQRKKRRYNMLFKK